MSSPIKLGIGLPAYGAKVVVWHTQMWLTFGGVLAQLEARFKLQSFNIVDACGVDVARNRLVADAIETGCDWLLMVDSDTWVEDAGDLLQMISDADREWETWCSASYLGRERQGWPIAAVVAPVPRRDPNDTRLAIYERQGLSFMYTPVPLRSSVLHEVESAGTALMAINLRFVSEHMEAPWFTFVWEEGASCVKPILSEDHHFCHRARKAGGKIFVDPRVRTRHLQRPQIIRSEDPAIVPAG